MYNKKRIILIVALILMLQLFIMPAKIAYAESAGSTLTVRVGYFGESSDYRIHKKITRAQLESLPQYTAYYTNVTRVGTIMYTVARGPKMADVINYANIDLASTQTMHLRTTDATGDPNNWFTEFTAQAYLNKTRYYYPNINDKWETISESSGQALAGGLAGAQSVPTILAIESYSTKNPKEAKNINPEMMTENESYRFCTGQTRLTEMQPTNSNDVSSKDSAKWIFGIDVTLYGKPPKDDTESDNKKPTNNDGKNNNSNKTNDQSKKVGSAKGSKASKTAEQNEKDGGIALREVTVGAVVKDPSTTVYNREEMSKDSEELSAAASSDAKALAGGLGAGFLIIGLVTEIIYYRKEV